MYVLCTYEKIQNPNHLFAKKLKFKFPTDMAPTPTPASTPPTPAPTPPTPAPTAPFCLAVSAPLHGIVSNQSSAFEAPAVITYSCNAGYEFGEVLQMPPATLLVTGHPPALIVKLSTYVKIPAVLETAVIPEHQLARLSVPLLVGLC